MVGTQRSQPNHLLIYYSSYLLTLYYYSFNKSLMTDKHNLNYIPQVYKDIKTYKNYATTQTNGTTSYQKTRKNQPYSKQETTVSHKPFNPIGATYSSGEYIKNYSLNLAHLHSRMGEINRGENQDQNKGLAHFKQATFELRSTMPVNQMKKTNTEFLRNTTLASKPKEMYPGLYNYNDNWTQLRTTESRDNKIAQKKLGYSPKFDNYLNRTERTEEEKEFRTKFSKQFKTGDELQKIKNINKVQNSSIYKSARTKQYYNPSPYSPPSICQNSSTSSSDYEKIVLKNNITLNDFSVGKSLGVGKFAQVFLAKHNTSGFVLALKRLNKQRIKEYQMEFQVIQQIKIQAFLSHPNIVQCYGVFNDSKYIYLMLEYLESGTLFDYIGDKYYLEQKEAAYFLRQICGAIKYLHNKDIAHRDIKPQNIIISYGLVKLCDFGWSARVITSRKTYCGTFSYAPPEIHERKSYDQSVDLWCIGILAYEMLTNQVPFQHKDRKITMQKITNIDKNKIQFPSSISIQARDFIESLLKKNPEQRLKAHKTLQHPFLKQYQQES